MNKTNNLKGSAILLLAAFLWGISFVSQNEGVNVIDPFAFNGIRTLMGAFSLIPVILVFSFAKKGKKESNTGSKKDLLLGSLFCGLVLCLAATLQTFGIKQGAGESGFITALYIVFVPVISIFLKKKIHLKSWLGVLIAFIGLYYLCGSFAFNINQIYLLLCAFFFAIHILLVDYYSPRVDGVKLSCLQFFVAGGIDCIIMFFVDIPTLSEIVICLPHLLYAGVVSCAVAYTLQIVGQKYINPTAGSLLMSFESVFAVLAGWIIQNNALSNNQIIGCIIIFIAIILVQLPESKKTTL